MTKRTSAAEPLLHSYLPLMGANQPLQVIGGTGGAARQSFIMQKPTSELGHALEELDREDLLKLAKGLLANGVALSFHGKRTAMEIAKRVRPRVMRRENRLHVGPICEGYTVWSWRNGRLKSVRCAEVKETIEAAIAL